MLSQLIYVSKRPNSCTDAEIDDILSKSVPNNRRLGITGVLLYTPNKFLQYIEGEYKDLMGLYNHIKNDPRHYEPFLVSLGPVRQRQFPSWQTGAKKLSLTDIEFRTDIGADERRVFLDALGGKEGDGEKLASLLKKIF